MDEEDCRFARRMIEPMLRAFKQEVAEQRANGASEADIEAMLARIESLNRGSMEADQLAFFMQLFREAIKLETSGLYSRASLARDPNRSAANIAEKCQ